MSEITFSKKFIDNITSEIKIDQFMESEFLSDFIQSGHSDWANTRCPMPDHDDNNPSFGVNIEANVYNCFGCGATGNIINLVRKVEGLNFIEAIQRLSLYANIDIETIDYDVKFLINELNNSIEKFLRSENTNYPGGLTETEFLLAFGDKIKKYERISKHHPDFISWVDDIYKEVDANLQKENTSALIKLWKKFVPDAKIKLREIYESE